jgi:hypothetical protein
MTLNYSNKDMAAWPTSNPRIAGSRVLKSRKGQAFVYTLNRAIKKCLIEIRAWKFPETPYKKSI